MVGEESRLTFRKFSSCDLFHGSLISSVPISERGPSRDVAAGLLLKFSPCSVFPGACRRQWVLSQARVALALVLVKIKPSGVSARQYAEALASKLRILDEGWKKEARALQEQVLRLRQELLMSRVVPAGLAASSSEAAGGTCRKYIYYH